MHLSAELSSPGAVKYLTISSMTNMGIWFSSRYRMSRTTVLSLDNEVVSCLLLPLGSTVGDSLSYCTKKLSR
jgi:hypothetical protein